MKKPLLARTAWLHYNGRVGWTAFGGRVQTIVSDTTMENASTVTRCLADAAKTPITFT